MDELRFKALIEAYGADVDRWPEAERAAGRARLAASGGQDAGVRAAAALDALLAEIPPAEARAALIGRILASAPTAGRRSGSLAGAVIALEWRGLRAQAVAASLALLSLGLVAGWSTGHALTGFAAADALIAAAYGDTTDDLFTVEGL